MPDIKFHPDVSQEVRTAYQWYEEQAQGLGDDFLIELEYSFKLIRKQPNTWPVFSARTRRFLLNKFPFSVIYTPSTEVILVLAVMHNRQKPRYWGERE
ncbi:type II toxin-antitoxin system RelE/ParE family toxin [Neptuniibacter sp. PT34_22]|uniref:type II toxin-antitoxin system RelE/ParE family toxin n=1 Tax=Neptuniibacter sp. PT34_22 TaxID=3398205 RepID=UPI0039F62F4F